MKIYSPLTSENQPALQEIEVSTTFQVPNLHIIGLPAPEVSEAKERIRSAIEASDLTLPKRKIILNLSPANIRKKGTGLDLAMALRILSESLTSPLRIGAWGELGLDGTVKPVGQLTRAIYGAWQSELPFLFVSAEEMSKATTALKFIKNSRVFSTPPPRLIPISSLRAAWDILQDLLHDEDSLDHLESLPSYFENEQLPLHEDSISLRSLLPLSPLLERVIGISAAGLHHVFLVGPRGSGKSHALEWLIALQQPSSPEDRLQHRLLMELNSSTLNPLAIRRISSQVRPAALVGGATSYSIRPGEYSLAHGGLLIADEFPEWPRDSRESLREPLERGRVTLTRAAGSFELPARFLLAANGNFCPCGGWPVHFPRPPEESMDQMAAIKKCRCPENSRRLYLSRLSGPILDRIDLVAVVTAPRTLSKTLDPELLLEKVRKTQERLIQLWGQPPGLLSGTELETIIQQHQFHSLFLSSLPLGSLRSRHKLTRVALSLAVWNSFDIPQKSHWLEAFQYRPESLVLE